MCPRPKEEISKIYPDLLDEIEFYIQRRALYKMFPVIIVKSTKKCLNINKSLVFLKNANNVTCSNILLLSLA